MRRTLSPQAEYEGSIPFARSNLTSDQPSYPERSQQRLFRLAGIALLVAQEKKRALRQVDLDAMKRAGGERGRDHEIGDRGGAIAGFHRNAHGFVRRQFEANIEVRQFDVEFFERRLEHRSGA